MVECWMTPSLSIIKSPLNAIPCDKTEMLVKYATRFSDYLTAEIEVTVGTSQNWNWNTDRPAPEVV